MQTAEQVIENIHKLTRAEQERVFAKLSATLEKQKAKPEVPQDEDPILALSGCVDLGECLVPFPDREWVYRSQE